MPGSSIYLAARRCNECTADADAGGHEERRIHPMTKCSNTRCRRTTGPAPLVAEQDCLCAGAAFASGGLRAFALLVVRPQRRYAMVLVAQHLRSTRLSKASYPRRSSLPGASQPTLCAYAAWPGGSSQVVAALTEAPSSTPVLECNSAALRLE